jgi:predicted ATPase/DNA-binding SARP family transcriptional activator
MRLSLFFLGPFQVTLEDQPAAFATDRARALLAYIAVEADRPHRREALAGLLWPDQPESLARRNLSQALVRLRRAIDDYRAAPPFLLITAKTVQFNAASAELDVARFESLLAACAAHSHPELPALVSQAQVASCPPCIERLEEAAGLYRGEFLQGLFLADGELFEEWALFKREQLHRQALDALHTLTTHYEEKGAYDRAQGYAARHLALEPWHEGAHRQLMRVLALGGDRSAALAQYETCWRVLADELGVEPTEETVALYEQIRAGQLSRRAEEQRSRGEVSVAPPWPADEPALAQASGPGDGLLPGPPAPLHNLPSQTTSFVGRKEELAELARWLADPEVRLATILGPGGIGKTRLAIEAAQAHLDAFPDGVCYVPLALVDPAYFAGSIHPLITALADALDLAFHGGDTPRGQLLAYLQGKEMLLVLDDFEHLLETVELLSDLLSHLPRLKVLVTSRERLNLQEEWIFSLAGMRVPAEAETRTSEVFARPGSGKTSEVLATYDAVQLFWQHARQVQPHFDPSAEWPWVVRICQLVDGMPLAIELAAAWLRLMPYRAIVQEIEGNVDFLATTLRNVPGRHRSLRAVFDQSWYLLSEAEQAVLKKLSVFRGGFQRETAEAVTDASLEQLASLVDKSLLQVTPAGRYHIHELIRQYAAQKLRQTPGDYEQARSLHCLIYLDFLRGQEAHLKGVNLKGAKAAITAELDNVRAAWRWAVERGQLLELKSAMEGLWFFYEAKGWILEGDDDFGQAVASLRRTCAGLTTPELAAARADSCPVLGLALVYEGWFQSRLGRFEEAKPLFQESLSILRSAGDRARRERACALFFFGLATLYFGGEPVAAIGSLQESLALFNQVDDTWGKGMAMSVLGQATLALGQGAEAERLLQESIAILTKIGNLQNISCAMSALGQVAQKRGQISQAEAIYLECLKIRAEIGDRTGMAFSLCDLGEVARLGGAYDQARRYYEQSLASARETGLPTASAEALRGMGNLAERRGDYAQAKGFFQESLAVSRTGGLFAHSPSALTGLGWAALGLGEAQEARQHFHQALRLEARTQRGSMVVDALAGLAHYLARVGEPERALELLALTSHHPAGGQETRDRVACLGAELVAQLPPEVAAAAQARGKASRLEEVVAEVLGEHHYAH